MNKTSFNNFEEAASYAKSLAIKGINHQIKREGEFWHVHHDSISGGDSNTNTHKSLLELEENFKKQKESLLNNIEKLKGENIPLQEEITALRNSIELEVENRLSVEKTNLENMKNEVAVLKKKVRREASELEQKIKELSLLKKAYQDKFGKAEVKKIEETVSSSTSMCSRCGGDGGINGGCQKCDGKGWVISAETIVHEVVEFK